MPELVRVSGLLFMRADMMLGVLIRIMFGDLTADESLRVNALERQLTATDVDRLKAILVHSADFTLLVEHFMRAAASDEPWQGTR